MPPRLLTCSTCLLTLACAPAAHAFLITPLYPNPDDFTPDQRALIRRAADDWFTALTADTAPAAVMQVNFLRVNAGAGAYLGQWQFAGQIPTAFPYSTGIIHNIYLNEYYFPQMSFSAEPPPSTHYDFLTLIRHELGHALGFADRLYLDNGTDRWLSHIANNTFDPAGLNLPMRPDNTHLDLPGDLMYHQLSPGLRKTISPADIAMLSRAYDYLPPTPIPEPASLAIFALGLLLRRRPRQRFSAATT